MFATIGFSDKLVSDNRQSYMFQATKEFLQKNNVANVTTPPYLAATNGQAERMAYERNQALERSAAGEVECHLARFLLKQHTTVNGDMYDISDADTWTGTFHRSCPHSSEGGRIR